MPKNLDLKVGKFLGIPASLGGPIFMNAGTALGEIGDLVKSVRILTETGEIEDRPLG